MDSHSSQFSYEQLKSSIRNLCYGKARFLTSLHTLDFSVISVFSGRIEYNIS